MTVSDLSKICRLSDEQRAARRDELRRTLFPHTRGRESLCDGVALTFDVTPALRAALDAFVRFERECCPGLAFSVVEADAGLRLEIRGLDPRTPELDAWLPAASAPGWGTSGRCGC